MAETIKAQQAPRHGNHVQASHHDPAASKPTAAVSHASAE
jgi:hypothetical protein